ncbi:MAG: FtsQ-type POTRA domain-containing protein, partial [Verrucomicrobia bacterium]|nr:FtsQ-type POTRA domain-containing protein [Verrucomicrobiota bacterium]
MRRQQRTRARNQRLSSFRQRRQQHLLDVKVRSRKAVAHRNRRVMVIFSKIVLVIALLSGIYVGGQFAAKRFFLENPDYKLTNIEVQTDGTLQREQILTVADLHEGENIFRVNLARVHDRLQELP